MNVATAVLESGPWFGVNASSTSLEYRPIAMRSRVVSFLRPPPPAAISAKRSLIEHWEEGLV